VFDLVNVKLLLKRLETVGIPEDLIYLVKVWVEHIYYYISLDGKNLIKFDLLLGTVQGSVLGPVLNAIFVSPILDIVPVLSFAEHNYTIESNTSKVELVKDMEKSLEAITKWLWISEIKVNQEKTEMCLYFKHNNAVTRGQYYQLRTFSRELPSSIVS
jgi:hypothetical protein